jgi:hypothetical protein
VCDVQWKEKSNEYRGKWEQANAQVDEQTDVADLRKQLDDARDHLEGAASCLSCVAVA